MNESNDSRFGIILGVLVAVFGVFYLIYGIALLNTANRVDARDGILLGGSCLAVAFVILRRRYSERRRKL